ncbi:MAG: hypothetical protein AAF740_09120 [Bacteroidota bacterium]
MAQNPFPLVPASAMAVLAPILSSASADYSYLPTNPTFLHLFPKFLH